MAIEEDPPAGVPEWVVTYGDMMSLLLTFFIMLVSLSEVNANEKFRRVLQALQNSVGYRLAKLGPPGNHFPLNSMVQGLESLGSFSNDDTGRGGVKKEGTPGPDLRTLRTRDGDALRVGRLVIFETGSTQLNDSAREELVRIAAELAGKPNKIEVRAHAAPGPLPIGSPYPDKVVLTYERGKSVLRFLQNQGIERRRVRLTAQADIEPLPNSGDRKDGQLDRVEVLLLDEFTRNFVGPSGSEP